MARHRGHDPTRRNRNIGTAKQGRGRDNRMWVPWPDERHFTDRLNHPVLVQREIHGDVWGLVIEPTLRDFVHACTLDDIQQVLELLPEEDLEGVRMVVLRQPTRKQASLHGVWGRWRLTQALGPHDHRWQSPGGPWRLRHGYGPAIFLEAVPVGLVLRRSGHQQPAGLRDIERLRADGHPITMDGRQHVGRTTPELCRTTQLYRTLPHEVGHHVDSWRHVVRPSTGKSEGTWRALEARYWSCPERDAEAFADRYADEFRARMLARGHFPFERILDLEGMVADGLEPRWFTGRDEEGGARPVPAAPGPQVEADAELPARAERPPSRSQPTSWPPEVAPRRGGSVLGAALRQTLAAWWDVLRRAWRGAD